MTYPPVHAMIICHEHRFIFLRTRKTASTSTEIALAKHCGLKDVIAVLSAEEEGLKREFGARAGQNFNVPVWRWTSRDALKFALKGRRPRYTKHMTAGSLKRRIDRSVWKSYLKFCVERNPFDKAISLYYWRNKGESIKPTLTNYLKSVDRDSLSNFHIYSIGSKIEVDHIIRYEQLEEGLNTVMSSCGLPRLDLPKAKSEFRQSQAHYRDLMTDEARSIVERACSRELKLLDYEY